MTETSLQEAFERTGNRVRISSPPTETMIADAGRRRRHRMVAAGGAAAAVAVLVAGLSTLSLGDSPVAPPPASPPSQASLTGLWSLSSATIDGTEVAMPENGSPTLRVFPGGSGQAIAGCEVASIRVSPNGTHLEVLDTGYMLSCPFYAEDPTDGGYLAALRTADSAEVSGDVLTLSGERGVLHFIAVPIT
jgi:hypothetical protein